MGRTEQETQGNKRVYSKMNMPCFTNEDKETLFKCSTRNNSRRNLNWGIHLPESSSALIVPEEELGYLENIKFITKSEYTGHANKIGLQGIGEYLLPHKVKRIGYMGSSTFNGLGTQEYPRGDLIEGVWKDDVLISYTYHFADRLEFKEKDWDYCCGKDRRFQRSIVEGMRPCPLELKTNDNVPRKIPNGCYDVGEGFYNPKTKCIVSVDDHSKVLRIPSNSEATWIMDNCRKAWDQPTGYRPDLYERWCTGRRKEKESVDTKKRSVGTNKYSVDSKKDSVNTNKDSVNTNTVSVNTNTDSVGTNKDSVGTNKESVGINKDSVDTNKDLDTIEDFLCTQEDSFCMEDTHENSTYTNEEFVDTDIEDTA